MQPFHMQLQAALEGDQSTVLCGEALLKDSFTNFGVCFKTCTNMTEPGFTC